MLQLDFVQECFCFMAFCHFERDNDWIYVLLGGSCWEE